LVRLHSPQSETIATKGQTGSTQALHTFTKTLLPLPNIFKVPEIIFGLQQQQGLLEMP
jgi:hypothetical protein